MSGRRQHMTVTLEASTLRRVTKAAAGLDINRSQFVEAALLDYLERAELEAKFVMNPRVMKAFAEAFSKPGVMSALAKAIGHEVNEAERQAVLDFMRKAGGAE